MLLCIASIQGPTSPNTLNRRPSESSAAEQACDRIAVARSTRSCRAMSRRRAAGVAEPRGHVGAQVVGSRPSGAGWRGRPGRRSGLLAIFLGGEHPGHAVGDVRAGHRAAVLPAHAVAKGEGPGLEVLARPAGGRWPGPPTRVAWASRSVLGAYAVSVRANTRPAKAMSSREAMRWGSQVRTGPRAASAWRVPPFMTRSPTTDVGAAFSGSAGARSLTRKTPPTTSPATSRRPRSVVRRRGPRRRRRRPEPSLRRDPGPSSDPPAVAATGAVGSAGVAATAARRPGLRRPPRRLPLRGAPRQPDDQSVR